MHAVVLQIVCALAIVAAVVFFVRGSREGYGEARAGQVALAAYQIVLCGWFFALCVSDFLDAEVNFSLERLVVDDFQAVDIPLNYAALFMRPVLFASLALAYRVWLDHRRAADRRQPPQF